ncbi:integrase core domain-containing protein [Bosea sp. (in: a-proteobacteria)]|uniref:integrase core domain-containing protein n=1 Tax=Bosea sp. (in: a-proteobacteria) TaxID=1871050 RepID=UPI0035615BDC
MLSCCNALLSIKPRRLHSGASLDRQARSIPDRMPQRRWFLSLPDAREKVEAGRRAYNELRPHRAIRNKTPISRVNRPPASHGDR